MPFGHDKFEEKFFIFSTPQQGAGSTFPPQQADQLYGPFDSFAEAADAIYSHYGDAQGYTSPETSQSYIISAFHVKQTPYIGP